MDTSSTPNAELFESMLAGGSVNHQHHQHHMQHYQQQSSSLSAAPQPPNDHFLFSVFTVLLFNPLLGIAALAYSIKSRDEYRQGRHERAVHFARLAHCLNVVSLVFFVFLLICLAYVCVFFFIYYYS
mgnify:CR=1 FL=1